MFIIILLETHLHMSISLAFFQNIILSTSYQNYTTLYSNRQKKRIQLFFIPSTVKLWNRLDQSDRILDTLTKFKKAIRKEQSDNTKRIPKHLYYGPRKLNIILTQLRNSYSFLNYYLSKVNIVNDASCSCGAPRENVYHYFFTCPNYAEIRLTMTNNLNWIQTIDLNLLTCESGVLTYEENINILKHVFNFIKSAERFLVE